MERESSSRGVPRDIPRFPRVRASVIPRPFLSFCSVTGPVARPTGRSSASPLLGIGSIPPNPLRSDPESRDVGRFSNEPNMTRRRVEHCAKEPLSTLDTEPELGSDRGSPYRKKKGSVPIVPRPASRSRKWTRQAKIRTLSRTGTVEETTPLDAVGPHGEDNDTVRQAILTGPLSHKETTSVTARMYTRASRESCCSGRSRTCHRAAPRGADHKGFGTDRPRG